MFKVWLRCWLFGHDQHPQDSAPIDEATCMHCGEYLTYDDLVGDSRYKQMIDWIRYWLLRRWLPAKCPVCGARFGHRGNCDGIPF